jgi:hypothetical protein
LILCWNAEVLSQCPNAKLFPIGAVWTQEADTSQKKFQVSYLTSDKNICPGHQYRQDIFNCLPISWEEVAEKHGRGQDVKTKFRFLDQLGVTKHKSPPYLPTKREMLVPFQYSIVMENCQRQNNFTEKINDACATKTIPLYWGAPNVSSFYNADAIFSWNTAQDLFDTLNSLTPELYASKQKAIEENYHTALTYADRTGNITRAIIDSWTPKQTVHNGGPNIDPNA